VIPKTFFHDTDKELSYILYSDTDSMYINIPKIKPTSSEDAVKHANAVSIELNDIIRSYLNNALLPKMNVSAENNQTFFKNELTASSIIFLEVKKNYAYKITSKEGIIFPKPKVKYTGIPIVRSDCAKMTQDLIRVLIEDIALSDLKKEERLTSIDKIGRETFEKAKEDISNCEFHYIGVPSKWGGTNYVKEPSEIVGMRLYNTITETETFKKMTSGFSIPITIEDYKVFNSKVEKIKNSNDNYIGNIPLANLTYLVFPYTYDKEQIKLLLEEYKIKIEIKKVWDKIINKSVERILETIKNSK
jgi:hypothetical protein